MITLIMRLFGYKKQYKQSYIVPTEYKRKFLKALDQAQKFQTPYWGRKLDDCLNMFMPCPLDEMQVYITHDGAVHVQEGLSKDWGKGYIWVKTYDRT